MSTPICKQCNDTLQEMVDEIHGEYKYQKNKLKTEYEELGKQLRQKYELVERENEYLRKLICDARMFEAPTFPIIKSLPDHYGIQHIIEKIIR